MALWNKIFTAFRGAATEAGEAIVDKNALRILDQEIRDASESLRRSREDLTKLMAQRKLAQDKLQPKQEKADEYTRFIEQLLAKGDEPLALEVAEKLSTLEDDIEQETQIVAQYDGNVDTLKKSILKAESGINRLKQQVDTVKATANVQRAQAAIAAQHSGSNSSLRSAVDSLERIKSKQAEQAARIEAADEVQALDGDTDLKKRLAAAGVLDQGGGGAAILARMKNRALPSPTAPRALSGPDET